jgi:hypothetical protein
MVAKCRIGGAQALQTFSKRQKANLGVAGTSYLVQYNRNNDPLLR